MVRYKSGIRCGSCESPQTKVTLTRHGNRHTVRTRKCLRCGHSFRTIEFHHRYVTTDPKFDFLFREAK